MKDSCIEAGELRAAGVGRSAGQPEYAAQPELAIASLMRLMSRFPATRKQAVARSIVDHLRVVGADARLPEALRRCADELTEDWMAYALLGEQEAQTAAIQ